MIVRGWLVLVLLVVAAVTGWSVWKSRPADRMPVADPIRGGEEFERLLDRCLRG